MHANHVMQIRRYRERGFGSKDIAAITGHKRSDIQRVLAADGETPIRRAARLALTERPASRTVEEHQRIVAANFG